MSRTKFVRMARINGGKSEGSHTMTAGTNKAFTNWARISLGCPTAVGKDTTKNHRAESQGIHNRWWKRHWLVQKYNCSIWDRPHAGWHSSQENSTIFSGPVQVCIPARWTTYTMNFIPNKAMGVRHLSQSLVMNSC